MAFQNESSPSSLILPSSEETFLLSETDGGSNSAWHNTPRSGGSSNPSKGSLELRTLLSEGTWNNNTYDDDDDDDYNNENNDSSQYAAPFPRRFPPQRSYPAAVGVAILTFGAAIRFFGYIEQNQTNTQTQQQYSNGAFMGGRNAYGSLYSGDLAAAPLHASSYWDDETHHVWEEYLADHYDSSSKQDPFEAAAAGSLLGTTSTAKATATSSMTTTTVSHDTLLYFNTTDAFSMLNPLDADFFKYQNGWEAQITQALCSIATSAALLNSLRFESASPSSFELPTDPLYTPFPWATQHYLMSSAEFNPCVNKALGGGPSNADSVYHMGLGLSMVPRLLNCYLQSNGYVATPHPADPSTEKDDLKNILVKALRERDSRVLLNYDRGGIGQGPNGHGHWSPLGGYDPLSDRFLVMDVAKYKHPIVWVTWDDLYGGASTLDSCGETLSIDRTSIDWDVRSDPKSSAAQDLFSYLNSRCIPGYRGFVVVRPMA